MKRSPFRSTRLASALLVGLLSTLVYFPTAKIRAAAKAPLVTLRGAGRPFVNVQSARTLEVSYTGEASAVNALQAGAKPTALTSADFDADGAPDLVAGYSTANGGIVTLTRGNPDAFAPKDPSLYRLALQGKVPPTFMSKATAFSVPESPDFLATGDFNGDGSLDLLVGTHGGGLYVLDGDGHGNLAAPRQVELPGDVSALAVNGAGHVAVGIESGSIARLLMFDPRSSSGFFQPVATHSLSAPATSMEWGPLGINTSDLAVAAGNSVVVFYSALNSGAQSETIDLAFHVQALTIGDFTWDRDGRMEIAALGDDGAVHILQHGILDTRPLTAADIPGRRARALARMRKPHQDPTSLGAWAEAKQIAEATSSTAGVAPQSMLQVSHLAPAATYGLMVLDGAQKQINMLNSSSAAGAQAMTISGTPLAAHALPAMLNGSRGLAVLTSSQVAPIVMNSGPDPAFNVTTTADEDDAAACTNPAVTSGTGGDGVLSLREAVCEANNNGAAISTINVPAGTYNLSLTTGGETGEIQIGTTAGANISIIGAGATPADTIIKQTDGVDRIFEQDQPFAGNVPVAISNLTITGGNCTGNTGIDCGFGGGGMLGTGNTGDDLTLTNVVFDMNTTGALDAGGAVNSSANGNMTIASCTFSNNTATQSIGGALDFTVNASSGNLSITNSVFTNNTSTPSTVVAQGGALALLPGAGDTVTIGGSTFTGNQAQGPGSVGGAIYAVGAVTVSNSRIVGNSATSGSGFFESGGSGNTGTIINNWWGCNNGPNNSGCDHVDIDPGSTATFNPWLVLSISASSTQILPNGTSTLTADLTHDSSGGSGFSVPNGTPVAFGATLGTDNPTNTTLTSGQAPSIYTAGASAGNDTSVSATVDNQTVDTTINILDTVSFNTSPAGLSYTVDSTTYTTPQTFNWVVGSSHNVSTTSPQAGPPGSQYVFSSWSDSGAQSHAITAPTAETTYTASFNPQYQLTTQASPSADGSVTPASGSFYASGATIPVTATANAGFQFSNWTSTGGTFDSTTAASTNFHMPSAAATVTANFVSATVNVTVGTSPAGLAFSVDSTPYTSAQNFSWTIGTPHTIATTSPQSPSAGTQYTFANWSDGGALSHTVTASTGTTSYTASFNTSYRLTTAANPPSGGTVTPASGNYYAPNTVVPLTATANINYAFSSWTGNVANANSPSTTVTMNGPQSVSANFVQVPLTASPSSLNFGSKKIGGSHTMQVTVRNVSATKVTVGAASLTSTGGDPTAFSFLEYCHPRTLNAGGKCIIAVTFKPHAAGLDTATLNIPFNGPGSPLEVPMTGTGVP